MKNFVGLLVAGAALLGAANAQAATIFTDRASFLAATSAVVTDNFEENASGAFTQHGSTYVGSGFTISGGNTYTVDPNFFAPYYNWGSGDVFDAEFSNLTFTLDSGLTALGFDFGNPTGFPGSGLVTINGVNYSLLGQPTFNFFGIVDAAGISPVTVNFNGGLGIVDNLSVGRAAAPGAVPEPSVWAMMIVGFGLVGGFMRRSRQTARLSYGAA